MNDKTVISPVTPVLTSASNSDEVVVSSDLEGQINLDPRKAIAKKFSEREYG